MFSFISCLQICFQLCSGSVVAKLGQVLSSKIKQSKALDTMDFPFSSACLLMSLRELLVDTEYYKGDVNSVLIECNILKFFT